MAKALEVIPRTLIQNCGADAIRNLTALRAKHATTSEDNKNFGINGETGKLEDMSVLGIWEPLAVKLQCYKTAIEVSDTEFMTVAADVCLRLILLLFFMEVFRQLYHVFCMICLHNRTAPSDNPLS
jgi:hypothetical protein